MDSKDSTQSQWLCAIVNTIWRIHPTNYKYYELSGGWQNAIAATTKKNKIFIAMKNGKVWKVDPKFGEYSEVKGLDGWDTCVAMVSYGDHLYAFCKNLHKITVKKGSGSYEQISEGWGNTLCAATLGDSIYAVTKSGKIWQIDPTSGAYKDLGVTDFYDTTAIVAFDGHLYTFGTDLRRVDPNNPSANTAISQGWGNTLPHSATVVDGQLFAVTKNGKVWKINPKDGSYIDSGLTNWGGCKFLFPIVRSDDLNVENTQNVESDTGYDIFISHRQVSGGDLAMTIKLLLLQENPKLRIFLDVDDLHEVHNLEKNVENSKNVILLVTEGALERPFVQLEIRAGLKYKKNFVLVHDPRSCPFPTPSSVPEDIREVTSILAVPWMREKVFREVSLKEIIKKLQL